MKITKGQLAIRFADCFGIDADEVVEWINTYVNGPWSPALAPLIEPDESGRLESIKAYISMRVDTSLTARVKGGAPC